MHSLESHHTFVYVFGSFDIDSEMFYSWFFLLSSHLIKSTRSGFFRL